MYKAINPMRTSTFIEVERAYHICMRIVADKIHRLQEPEGIKTMFQSTGKVSSFGDTKE